MKSRELRYGNEYKDATEKMSFLKEKLRDGVEVAIFRDNGWGDDPESGGSSYTIIVDGNGQISMGDISPKCFEMLLENGVIEHNTLRTYKDRGYHKFLGPKEATE
jgi:hypothetical protein